MDTVTLHEPLWLLHIVTLVPLLPVGARKIFLTKQILRKGTTGAVSKLYASAAQPARCSCGVTSHQCSRQRPH